MSLNLKVLDWATATPEERARILTRNGTLERLTHVSSPVSYTHLTLPTSDLV